MFYNHLRCLMKRNVYQDLDSVMDELGLFVNDRTGGFFDDSINGKLKIKNSFHSDKFEIITEDGQRILFFNEVVFLKSLFDTEAAFNIKLFV